MTYLLVTVILAIASIIVFGVFAAKDRQAAQANISRRLGLTDR